MEDVKLFSVTRLNKQINVIFLAYVVLIVDQKLCHEIVEVTVDLHQTFKNLKMTVACGGEDKI